MSLKKIIPLTFFTIAFIAVTYVLLETLGIFSCFSCSHHNKIIPLLAAIYFLALIVVLLVRENVLVILSPYGLVLSMLVALYLQSQLSALCVPCYVGHIAHVAGWAALLFLRNNSYFTGGTSCIIVIALPLLFFAMRPISFHGKVAHKKGEVVIVLSSSCTFCKGILPELGDLRARLDKKDIGLALFGVGDVAALKKDVSPLMLYRYSDTIFSPELSLQGYPAFIYVNPKGKVEKIVHGYIDPVSKDVLDTVKALGWASQ